MSDLKEFTVLELKEALRELNCSMKGLKNKLFLRLQTADPTELWKEKIASSQARQQDPSSADEEEAEAVEEEMTRTNLASSHVDLLRELEMREREKRLMEKELEITRRKLEMLRGMGRQETSMPVMRPAARVTESDLRPKVNINAIAELLPPFNGKEDYDRWERQLKLLKSTYELDDKHTRVLIGSRLKGKALDWLYSKVEFLELPVEQFLMEMKNMFRYRVSKLVLRKEFESRVWKRGEAFSEYLHDKVILANQVPVDERELLDYIVEGILDPALRDQARIQKLNSTAIPNDTMKPSVIIGRDVLQEVGYTLQLNVDQWKTGVEQILNIDVTDEKGLRSNAMDINTEVSNCVQMEVHEMFEKEYVGPVRPEMSVVDAELNLVLKEHQPFSVAPRQLVHSDRFENQISYTEIIECEESKSQSFIHEASQLAHSKKENKLTVEQQTATQVETNKYFEHKSSQSKFFRAYPEVKLNNQLMTKNIKRILDDPEYCSIVESSDNLFFKFITKFMNNGPSRELYKERFRLLKPMYEHTKSITKTEHQEIILSYDAADSPAEAWMKLIESMPSSRQMEKCNKCGDHETVQTTLMANHNIILQKGFRALQKALNFHDVIYNKHCQCGGCLKK
ncbi:hypothetical protein DMN91_003461 [Ooceraea biroi]|uniref:SAP domain-containing protein n=1 Tax=Ooceraea biroi TaxID=2015173 RepID=A0A3L8DU33_OOCBI|nr:hypothetical protein DMN91_003461 [Ooceraea biroi]